MTEVEYFLHPCLCDELINFFKKNKNKSELFKKRSILDLSKFHENPIISNIVKKYIKLKPRKILKNIELVSWPIGESHDWHDDTIFYDVTTITYLNDNYKGGITTVEDYDIKPEKGKICIFDSDKKHKVSSLEDGERFVILAWYKNG